MPKKRLKKGGRLHLRLDADLVEEIHAYAVRNHTNLTVVATELFVKLLKEEAEQKAFPEAEQV